MQRTFLLQRLLLCCLFMLGGMSFADAQRPPRPGINGPFSACVGSTSTYTANNPFTFPGFVYNFTWTLSPSTAGTVLSTTNTGAGAGTANIQWHTPGNVTITATSTLGDVYTYTVQVGAIPEPVLTTDVLLACQPLGNDPKEEQRARFDEVTCQWVCENSTVKYTVAGSPGSTYTWTATGALSLSPSGNDCYVSWGPAGSGTVTVTETTIYGCKASKTMCVKIQQGPDARFRILNSNDQPVVICRGGSILIEDHSTGTAQSPIVSWHWDFGDGQVSNQSPGGAGNPITHQYDVPGGYKVTLIVTNSCGCTDEMTLEVVVKDGEAPVITCPRVMCENESAEYFVNIPCDVHSWNVEGGSIGNITDQSVVVTWDHVDPATGFGLISYTACKECEMTTIEPVPVVVNHAQVQGEQNICVGQEYVYRLPKWPTTQMNWYVASGSAYLTQTDQRNEIVVVATAPGPITLACSYFNTFLGCEGYTEIGLQANPKAQVTGSQLLCKNQTASYSAGGYFADWVLTNATGSVTATGSGFTFTPPAFTVPGTYTLRATGATFCPADDYAITVKDLPAAPTMISGPSGACPGIPVQFSAGPAIAGTTFLWSVSSGSVNSATGAETYITFTGAPNYTVSVQRITADAAQCASTALTRIVTDPMPALSISGPATVCHSTTQTYGESYGGADAYEWSISPANLGSVINPNGGIFGGGGNIVSILWNVPPGTGATAKIYVKVRKCNTYRTDSFNVFVRGVPTFVAKLSSGAADTTICSGSPVNLQLVPSYAVTSTDSVTWQWGDGSQNYPGPSFAGIYAHIYNTNGASSQSAFQPVVTIKNPNGCLGTATAVGPVIHVKPAPVAFISPSGPIAKCGPFTQQLTATLTTGIGGSNTFAWSPSGPNSPTLTTSSLGLYSVTVSNSNGCSSTSNIVEIKDGCPKELCGPGPSPAIVLTGSNTCGTINVNAAVTGPMMFQEWIYANTVTVTGMNATSLNATVTQAGNYQFDYFAFYRNNAGDTCVVDSAITVLVPYMAGMRYEIACNQAAGNYKVTLADRSSLYPGIGVNRTYYNSSWVSLGTGLSTAVNVAGGTTNTYYMVIQDNAFMHPACTTSVTVTLPAFPVADFSLATNAIGCVGNAFNFWNQSQGANLSYLWNYGPAQSQGAEGGVVYTTPYINSPVSLTVTDQYGCVSTKSQLITANANPYSGTLTASPNPACLGTPVNLAYTPTAGGFMPSGTGMYSLYKDNMQLSNTVPPASGFTVTEPGGYWIKATGIYGCESKTNTAAVEIKQIPAAVISGNAKQCANVPFTLTTEPVPGATYVWGTPGSMIPSTSPTLNESLNAPGTYTYTVTVMLNGCSRTSAPFTVTVNPQPAQPSVSFNVDCDPQYLITLDASGPSGTYNWSNGANGPTMQTYQGGQYQVFFTDENGCKSSSQINTPKDPREYLWIFPKGCFCKLRTKTYLIGPITPFAGWSWDEDGVPVSSGNGLMQLFYPSPGHTYTMTLDNGYCAVTSEPMHYDDEVCGKLGSNLVADNVPMTAALTSTGTAMRLVPNPARETAAVVYSFTPGSRDRLIEVYDMIGRKLQTHTVTADRGELVLPVAEFAAGVYQVIMKENGTTVQQSKLSLTR